MFKTINFLIFEWRFVVDQISISAISHLPLQRQDLTAENRELLHSGKIGWKSARGRVYDVLAVVLTDLIVFLQKNEQKYTFLSQDNKVSVNLSLFFF